MNSELFKAILAMDSYNRGYGEGIVLPTVLGTTKIGNATITADSLNTVSTSTGVAAGFYAVAYTIGGQTIISYRGTNAENLSNFATDAFYGYGIGAGVPSAVQGNLAIEFYKSVSAIQTVHQLTGHSLGGGLAGYVGALYGRYVSIFNNMTYENSVRSLHALIEDPLTFASIYDNQGNVVNYDPVKLAFAEEMKNKVYGSGTPYDPVFMGIAKYTTGELLYELLPLRPFQTLTPTAVSAYGGVRSPVDLHSQALLINLMYAEQAGLTDWHNIGWSFINALFDPAIATAAGFSSGGGVYPAEQKMLSAIAYSAIDEGQRIFGDTAIRAMFIIPVLLSAEALAKEDDTGSGATPTAANDNIIVEKQLIYAMS